MPSKSPTAQTTCASCGRPVRGRFCTHCGTLAEASACAACGGTLEPGDRHCARCGAGVGAAASATAPAADGGRTGWIVAGIAFAALFLVVLLQWAGDRRARDMAQVGDPTSVQAGAPMGGGGASAMDIASMPPREQMDRLYDRVMRLREEGKSDSVAFFAPMVMGLYARPELQPLDADLRYDFGTIANASGDFAVEKAQADTVLAATPTHLLGLVMAARNARARKDEAAAKRFEQRLLQAESAERAKNLPEYERHKNEIEEAARLAKGGTK